MQLTRIKATNFKTYLSLDLDLSVDHDRPIIMIGGMNGGGKTTLFEAICGALYGLKIKNKQHFNELLNNGALGKTEPKIELELMFTGQVLHMTQKYVLRRSYILNAQGRPVESVYLNMNGTAFMYGTATPAAQRALSEQQVNRIIKANLPEELSQYFLFDAMQSSKLLEENVFAQIIRDNIQNVMGFNKYLQLKRAAEKLLQAKTKERMNAEQEIREYESLCRQKEEAENQLKQNEAQQEQANKYLYSMKEAYDKAKAGAEDQAHIKMQVEQLEGTIRDTERKANDYVAELKEYVNNMELISFLPKLADALGPFIDNVQRKKDELKKSAEAVYKYDEVSEITAKVIEYLKSFSLCTSDIDEANVVEHIMAMQKGEDKTDEYAYLTDGDVAALGAMKHLSKVNTFIQMDAKRREIDTMMAELPNIRIQRDSLQSSLSKGNTSIIEEYEAKKAELAILSNEHKELTEKIKTLANRIRVYDNEIQQEPDVKYDTLVKLVPFFEEVTDALLEKKKTLIEKEMTEQLNKLLISYKGNIDRVELTNKMEDFSIKLYHKAGNQIALSQLNAASKQIFIQVLLKVLRNLGDYNPPVMIDTVMGVLDEESRNELMEEYFPHLAEQTILLCTTSEIRKDSDYKKLEAFTSKTYTLNRNVAEQNTTVSEGYFGIHLNK